MPIITLRKMVSLLIQLTHTLQEQVDRLAHAKNHLLQDINVTLHHLPVIPLLMLLRMPFKMTDQLKPDSTYTQTS